jgi:uncharacterized SAM-binding protein YcdF (DUF218 family)
MQTAIVVPGHGRVGADGVHRISARCLRLVGAAEQLADELDPALVVFSGWSSRSEISEAEQMRDAWRGRDVELVLEPTAKHTGENASRTVPLLRARGIHAAVVVCTATHLTRVRMLFGRIYGESGIEVRFHVVRGRRIRRAVLWEALAIPLVPVQLAAAERELRRRS